MHDCGPVFFVFFSHSLSLFFFLGVICSLNVIQKNVKQEAG